MKISTDYEYNFKCGLLKSKTSIQKYELIFFIKNIFFFLHIFQFFQHLTSKSAVRRSRWKTWKDTHAYIKHELTFLIKNNLMFSTFFYQKAPYGVYSGKLEKTHKHTKVWINILYKNIYFFLHLFQFFSTFFINKKRRTALVVKSLRRHTIIQKPKLTCFIKIRINKLFLLSKHSETPWVIKFSIQKQERGKKINTWKIIFQK